MIQFERISEEDLDWIHRIYPGNFSKHWVHFNWYWYELSLLRSDLCCLYIFVSGLNRPIGVIAYGRHYEDELLRVPTTKFELHHIIVDHSFQSRGFGRISTIVAIQRLRSDHGAKDIVIACHPDNHKATQLYRSLGGKLVGRNYDGDPLFQFLTHPFDSAPIVNHACDHAIDQVGDVTGELGWETESIQAHTQFDLTPWKN